MENAKKFLTFVALLVIPLEAGSISAETQPTAISITRPAMTPLTKLLVLLTAVALLSSSGHTQESIPVFVASDPDDYGLASDAVNEIRDWVQSHPNLRLVETRSENCLTIGSFAIKDSSNGVHVAAVIPIVGFARGGKAGALLLDGDYSLVFGSGSWGVESRTLSGLRRSLNRIFDSHALTFFDALFEDWVEETWDSFEFSATSANYKVEEYIRTGVLERSERYETFSDYGENSSWPHGDEENTQDSPLGSNPWSVIK